jgi:uncharacterized protein YegJ (DUF2314 family)
MRIQHLAAALLCLPALSSAQSITERAEKDQTIDMRNEEPAMRRAMEKARATLDEFLVKAKQPAAGTDSYAVKVAVPEGPNTEYFWVNDFTWSDASFTGRINNEPRIVKNLKLGQIYKFSRSQIVDWTYIDEKTGRTFGNFTACAILSKEPPAQAEEFKRRYGLDCS